MSNHTTTRPTTNPEATWSATLPPKPYIRMIPASELQVKFFEVSDDGEMTGYQRGLDPSTRKPDAKLRNMVKKMKADFVPDLYLPISVAEWQGEYFVYDGNARRTMAMEVAADPASHPDIHAFFDFAEDPLLRCQVSPDCEPMRQAWLFVKCNEDRRGVPWIDRHHSNLYQGSPVALEAEAIAHSLGISVARGEDPKVSAVQALYSTLQYDGEGMPLRSGLLYEVLHVAKESWFEGRPNKSDTQYCFSDRTLDALALLLDTFDHDQMDRGELIYKLRQVLIKDIILRSTTKTSAHGSNNVTVLATEMARIYNAQTDIYPSRRLRLGNLDPKKRRQRRTEKVKGEGMRKG